MNQVLIALCPNCHTDASTHNKVLYDGIFLICHSCGYGWYYNIQIVNTNTTNEYNSKSSPLSTLQAAKVKNYPTKTNAPISKRNIKNKIIREHSTHTLKNHNYTKKETTHHKKSNTNLNKKNINTTRVEHNNSTAQKNKTKSSKYTSTPYDNNVYYEQNALPPYTETKFDIPINLNKHNVENTPYTHKSHSDFIFEESNKQTRPHIPTNTNNSIKKENYTPSVQSKPKENLTNNNVLEQQIIINPNNPTSTKSSEVIINLSNLPTKHTTNPQSKKEDLKTNQYTPEKNTLIKEVITLTNTKPSTEVSLKQNNKNKHLPDIDKQNASIHTNKTANTTSNKQDIKNSPTSEIYSNNNYTTGPQKVEASPKQPTTSNIEIPSNTLSKEVELTEVISNKVSSTVDLSKSDETLNISTPNNEPPLQKPSLEILENNEAKLALNNFNISLNTKENLGLNPASLLKIEEQSQYNINKHSQTIQQNKKTPTDIKEYKNKLKGTFSTLLKNIVTIFTRPDLLLKTCAYVFIFGGAVSFLWYSSNLKQKKVKETIIHNPSFNNNINTTHNKSVKFAENVDITGMNPQTSYNNEPGFNNENITVAKEDEQNKINAFQKNTNIQDYNNISAKNTELNVNNKASSPTLLESVKYKFKDSWLSLKQHQQNAFSSVKLYQKSFKLNGEYNDKLISSNTLYNKDTTNSYLIKSLEIVFLENTGKVLGKRTILANQIINSNSGVELNIKINNPPVGSKNMYVFIKDKKKI